MRIRFFLYTILLLFGFNFQTKAQTRPVLNYLNYLAPELFACNFLPPNPAYGFQQLINYSGLNNDYIVLNIEGLQLQIRVFYSVSFNRDIILVNRTCDPMLASGENCDCQVFDAFWGWPVFSGPINYFDLARDILPLREMKKLEEDYLNKPENSEKTLHIRIPESGYVISCFDNDNKEIYQIHFMGNRFEIR